MEHGDLSNEVVPRLLLVWEGLLGIPPLTPKISPSKRNLLSLFRKNSGEREIDSWTINEQVVHIIWDRTWRSNFSFDLVTFISPEFGKQLKERMEEEDIPVSHVRYENINTFPRKIAFLPYVAAIYSANKDHQFTFGGKGRIIDPSDPYSLNSIGRF